MLREKVNHASSLELNVLSAQSYMALRFLARYFSAKFSSLCLIKEVLGCRSSGFNLFASAAKYYL